MKKILFAAMLSVAVLGFTGCADKELTSEAKSAKCGSGKCGGDKKAASKCGSGKCGASKESSSKCGSK